MIWSRAIRKNLIWWVNGIKLTRNYDKYVLSSLSSIINHSDDRNSYKFVVKSLFLFYNSFLWDLSGPSIGSLNLIELVIRNYFKGGGFFLSTISSQTTPSKKLWVFSSSIVIRCEGIFWRSLISKSRSYWEIFPIFLFRNS